MCNFDHLTKCDRCESPMCDLCLNPFDDKDSCILNKSICSHFDKLCEGKSENDGFHECNENDVIDAIKYKHVKENGEIKTYFRIYCSECC